MPLSGSSANGPANNVSDYSHSTVFTTSFASVRSDDVPPLLTIYTPPSSCSDRWMLIDNTLGTTTFVTTGLTFGVTSTRRVSAQVVVEPTIAPAVGIVRRDPMEPRQVAQAFNLTVWSLNSESLFTSCQPYTLPAQPLYSPGVCPNGQTIAEITQVQANRTEGGVLTSWRASCCRSGMTFGTDIARYCISSISTPFKAYAYVTRTYPTVIGGVSTFSYTTTYEYTTYTFTGTGPGMSGDGYSTFVVSNVTTISSALAVANPVIVAWRIDDLASFPPAYATALGKKIGQPLSALPSARVRDVPGLPSETGTAPVPAPSTSNLSTAAKVGIAVGSIVGALLIATVIFLLWLIKRRKPTPAASTDDPQIPEMEDHDDKLNKRKWFLGGKWRSEAETAGDTQELDGKTVHVVAGPPAELEAHEAQIEQDPTQSSER